MIQRHRLAEADYRGERFKDHPKGLKGNNDLLQLTRPDVIARDPRAVPRGRRRHRRDQHLRRHPVAQDDYGLGAFAREMNVAAARLARAACDKLQRAPTSRASSPARSGPTPTHREHQPRRQRPGGAQRHLRRAARGLPRAGRGPARRRLRPVPGRDDLRHAQRQGGDLRARRADGGKRRAPAGDRLRHGHRRLGPHPVRPDGAGVLAQRAPRPAAGGRPELRPRRGADAALHRGAGAGRRRHLRQLLPERRPAQPDERDRLRRDARDHRRPARGVRASAGFLNIAGGCCGTTPEHIARIAERVGQRYRPRPRVRALPGARADARTIAARGALRQLDPPQAARLGRCRTAPTAGELRPRDSSPAAASDPPCRR